MNVLFERSEQTAEPIYDDLPDQEKSFADQLIYWSLLLMSAVITILGFWKLVDLLMTL